MYKPERIARLAASGSGETKCVVFVDSLSSARESLAPHVVTVVAAYPFIKAFGVEVCVHKIDDLSALKCVKAIAPHTTVTTCMLKAKEALQIAPAYEHFGYGENISVVVIDTGVRPHLDFTVPTNRIYFHDFISQKALPYDDNGHGTAVSSILCGNGLTSGGRFSGIAPRARLISLKAIGKEGEGGAFAILEAMQWIYDNAAEYNIRVVCMSFGSVPVSKGIDPLSAGAEALWKKGIVVVASAGNDGPHEKTIRSPGCNPSVITVGGAEFKNGYARAADFSSRGPCGAFIKPDIIAPAVGITACGLNDSYEIFSGTSMAAPMVAGAAALILSRHPFFSPDRIKELLLSSAEPLPFSPEIVGRGLLSFSLNDIL